MNILPWLDDFSAQRDPRIAVIAQMLSRFPIAREAPATSEVE